MDEWVSLWVDGSKDIRIEVWMDVQVDVWMGEWIEWCVLCVWLGIDERTYELENGCVDGWMHWNWMYWWEGGMRE